MIFYQILSTFLKKMYRDRFGEFVCGYWDLNGEVKALQKSSRVCPLVPKVARTQKKTFQA